MTRRTWVRLDNASNIFLAARSSADPKVFRISAEMDQAVNPRLLQEALDQTYDRYPLYHAVLRSGVFWYYLQDSDLRPFVTAEELHTCAPIYQSDRRNLLFRVMHHRHRIILEVFHALSDGTGALWFLSDLLTAYVRVEREESSKRRSNVGVPHPPPGDGLVGSQGLEGADRDTPAKRAGLLEPAEPAAPVHELLGDSFQHYFRRPQQPLPTSDSDFGHAAAPAVLTVDPIASSWPATDRSSGPHRRRPRKQVYRVPGTRTPDHRTRAVELTAPTSQVLTLARAEGVTLTMYLTGLFFEAIRRSSGGLDKSPTVAASVPVNLRQFFPSTSPRNFFATVRVEHTYGRGADDLGSVCRHLDSQFRPKATATALQKKLQRLLRLERTPVLRIVPRPLKNVILNLVNRNNNRGLTIAVSNLGRVSLPEPADSHVGRMLFHVSAARPQLSVLSHAGFLTLSFTSPFADTGHIQEFARLLTSNGTDVSVAAARVTEKELAVAEAAELAETER